MAQAATLVVDNQSPRASDSNPGTRQAPFKTINAAAQKLKPGDDVLVHPGIYREAVTLRVSGTLGNPVTLSSAIPHAAIIDGADIVPATQIRAEANGAFSFAAPTIQSNPYWDDHSFGEWLYIGGEPLERVGERAKLAPMCFFEDYAAKRIIFQGAEDFSPRGAASTVEFATRDGLMAPEHRDINTVEPLNDVRIFGFTLQHNADWFGARRAINFRGRRWLIEDNVVRWSSWGGIMAQSSNNCTVRGNTVEWCGDTGIGGSNNANLLVEGNRVTHMNWRRINPSFDGGFGKFVLSIDCRLKDNESAYQFGFGPWLDIHNIGNVFQGNVSHDSIGGEGLFCEISSDNTFLDNVAYNIRDGAITFGESSGCVARHNIAFNSGYGLRVRGDFTRENDHALLEGGKTSNFTPGEAKFIEAINEIPDLSQQRRDEYASKYLLYWAAPRAFMSSNNLWWQNLSFGNGANYLEERDYAKPSATVNNLSDYNIFFPDSRFESPGGKHQDLEAWRKVSGRDEHSQVLDPMPAGAKLPDWAESKRAIWSQKMRTRDAVDALNLSLIDSPSAADCRARFFRSERATRVKLADAGVQAWVLDVEGQRTLAVWTTKPGQRRRVRLRVGAGAVTFENPYGTQSRRALKGQAIEILATPLPIYVRGVGEAVSEAPLAAPR